MEAHFTTELYFDLVEILVKVQNSVVLYGRTIVLSCDRRKLDGLGFINMSEKFKCHLFLLAWQVMPRS